MWGLPCGLLWGTSGRKDLYMVPCYSCHFYGIWTSRSKNVWGMLKSHQLGVVMQVTKGGSFHREGRFSLCNTAVLWNFIANLTGYILWKILLDTSLLLLFYVFEVAKARSATQSVLMILTLNWAILEKFSLLYPWTLYILNPPPSPLCLLFSITVLALQFLTATILLKQAPLPIQSHKNTLIAIENRCLNGVFLKWKVSIFP